MKCSTCGIDLIRKSTVHLLSSAGAFLGVAIGLTWIPFGWIVGLFFSVIGLYLVA